jgi:hypothetical protein
MASGMASGVAVSCANGMIGYSSFGAFNTGSAAKLKLMSSSADEGADGTEIPGTSSYPTGGISMTISGTFGAASYASNAASVTNSVAAVTQTNMPAVGSPGVVAASIYDGTPTRWWWGDLTTSVVTNSGDTLTFATSSITVQLNV